jgi:hypothetical protein
MDVSEPRVRSRALECVLSLDGTYATLKQLSNRRPQSTPDTCGAPSSLRQTTILGSNLIKLVILASTLVPPLSGSKNPYSSRGDVDLIRTLQRSTPSRQLRSQTRWRHKVSSETTLVGYKGRLAHKRCTHMTHIFAELENAVGGGPTSQRAAVEHWKSWGARPAGRSEGGHPYVHTYSEWILLILFSAC